MIVCLFLSKKSNISFLSPAATKEGANLTKHARFDLELSSFCLKRLILKVHSSQVKHVRCSGDGLKLGHRVHNLERFVPLHVFKDGLRLIRRDSLQTYSIALAFKYFKSGTPYDNFLVEILSFAFAILIIE